MDFKALPIFDLKIADERDVSGIFSVSGNVDSVGDRIINGAWTKTLAEGLPTGRVKVLWQHDINNPPIGVPLEVKEVGKGDLPAALRSAYPDATGGLYGKWRALSTPRGDEVLSGIKSGAITENSIGYDPVKVGFASSPTGPVRELKELRLFDISPVLWGANSATTNLKSAIPFKKAAMAPEDATWDGPKTMAALDGADELRMACAWVDAEGDPDVKGSYKLPHHTTDGKVVWAGVAASMAALMGSRGGVDIPEADRQGVFRHLAGHYEQFGKDAPDFKFLQFVWTAREVQARMALTLPDLKVGRTISAATQARIQQHADAMKDHVAQMDPHLTGINESIDALTNWIAGNTPDDEIAKPGGKAGTPYTPDAYDQETDEVVTCPECGKANDDDAVYCDQCGAKLEGKTVTVDGKPVEDYQPAAYHAEADETVACPKCDKMNAPDARFCDHCGVELAGRTDVMAPKAGAAPAATAADPLTSRLIALQAVFSGAEPAQPLTPGGSKTGHERPADHDGSREPAATPLPDDLKARLAELDLLFTP